MTIDVVLVQVLLGIILFFIINWIGKHSYSIGYMSISIFVRVEESPAFNFLVRVLTPVVYIILLSALLYSLTLDKFVINFYLVNIYYILFRLGFNLITGRGLLLNWYRQFLYWICIMVVSYFTYSKLISSKENLLPDFSTVANELWIIVMIFLFHVANNIRLSQDATIRRKEHYLKKMYLNFKSKYGSIVDEKLNNDKLKAIAYAILIFENFNRPKIARVIENIKFLITKKPLTLGVMQVFSAQMINDIESVKIGLGKINDDYKCILGEYKKGNKQEYYSEWVCERELILKYNNSEDYASEVSELTEIIFGDFYKKSTDRLLNKSEPKC